MMQSPPTSPTRKKFLLWSAVLLGSATLFKFFSKEEEIKPETVKMLTQDGILVEIDKSQVGSAGKNISDKELKEWVKK